MLYAPDCIEKNGKYYLYFCMSDESEGVAVSDHPEGPFGHPVQLPCGGIDPAIFVDDDGSAYYFCREQELTILFSDVDCFVLRSITALCIINAPFHLLQAGQTEWGTSVYSAQHRRPLNESCLPEGRISSPSAFSGRVISYCCMPCAV